ncbi:MAG: GspE/PulE family protein [Gloeomargarita sp. SKYBB_i_bin120]|nr:GspE/PulE family protein [Gloeomargarita sp. SKYG98]MCS7291519.1 GspE/PulE family protein [Gloeomargarita sp. SKYB120]MDW8177079.1 GspE/PulE family protein [Gloeomargarita sp. SKYBB_i_bin120]
MVNSPISARRALVTRQAGTSPIVKDLVKAGVAEREQVIKALQQSREEGRPLPEVLERMTGRALPAELVRQYKRQQLFELKVLYGVESLDPELNPISLSQIKELVDVLIPLETCRRYEFLPVARQEGEAPSLIVAMVNPDNLQALDELNRLTRSKGLRLRRRVITREDFLHLINLYVNEMQAAQATGAAIQIETDIDLSQYEELQQVQDEEAEIDLAQALSGSQEAPIVALANNILAKALTERASDIHVEPQEEFLRIRFRKDGVLQPGWDNLPKQVIPALTSRFKLMANLDIAERRVPQDGRIRRLFQGRKIDFRVSTVPTRYGEKICMRILDNSATQLGLDKLITDPETLQIVREMIKRPFGLILVTGPTGSGKTTTLYSCLAERNDPGININTAEDPIEYTLPGLTQVQVLREKGVDFATILRAFLRQDPDVILVGETRDKETAKTATEAALTGHLVLTTLHTNDAPSAIARLAEMGIESHMVSASLIGVLAQRLMRRVCTECRIPYSPTAEELARFGLSGSGQGLTFYRANALTPEQIRQAKAQGQPICSKCNGAGYKGRVGVYEVMRVTERIQRLITENAPTEVIKEVAVEEGMKTLLAYSLELVRQGLTTLEEVERVTFTDSGLEAELKAKRKQGLVCRNCQATLKPEWMECPYCLTPRFTD